MMTVTKRGWVVFCDMPTCKSTAKPSKTPQKALEAAERVKFKILHGMDDGWLSLCATCAEFAGVTNAQKRG